MLQESILQYFRPSLSYNLSLRPLLCLFVSGHFRQILLYIYSKTCLKGPLKKNTKIGFQYPLSLNAGRKYCRMLQESILQYFRPSLSYHLSLRPLFCLFLSGHLRQILLYMYNKACLKRPLKKNTKIGFQYPVSPNAGRKYCRMLQESIQQYFRLSLIYHLSLRPLFCLFLSGRLRQVLEHQNWFSIPIIA